MSAGSFSGEHPAAAASRRHLLAWRWLLGGLAVFVSASLVAWWQEPGTVPLNRTPQAWSFLSPIETNSHRRLPAVLDDLRGMYFEPSGRNGWAVGDDGRILATSNGGKNWRTQASGTTEELAIVTFEKDGLRGWAGNMKVALVATTDGGEHWQKNGETWQALLRKGSFDYKFARSKSPAIGRAQPPRSDTWTAPERPPPLENGGLEKLSVNTTLSENLLGWAIGDHGTIIATNDGGKTWHPQTSTSQPQLHDLWVDSNGSRGWAVGNGGTILATTNHGTTWKPQSGGVTNDLLAITCLSDAMHCWAGGRNGSLIATADGGRTWTRQNSTSQQGVTGLHFSSEKNGWATDAEGYKLETSDGGIHWSSMKPGQEKYNPLSSIVFPTDENHGWAIAVSPGLIAAFPKGRQSRITTKVSHALVKSQDGGRNWYAPDQRDLRNPLSVSLDKDGTHGVVVDRMYEVGRDLGMQHEIQPGILATTDDGGANWRLQKLPDALPLEAAKLAGDGRHGFAVGKGGQIFFTDDGGLHWQHAEKYQRWPAPWYWLAVTISTILVWMSWRFRPVIVDGDSVANVLAPDAAVLRPADDRLHFNGLARGISRFLRNTGTRPPLTLAITGDWGSGKSSLMQLVCVDLRRFGHRPIWFNAWHHQKEEHLFASLLGAIYAQAAPPLPSISGFSFRLRLLWARSRRHFVVTMIAVTLISALSLLSLHAFRAGGFDNIISTIQALDRLKELATAAFPGLLAALTAVFTVAKGTATFKANPAVLLRTTRQHMTLKTAGAQNSFREVFARQFEELTTALPYRLVIVIDDLDRCKPSAVIEVMEAVNYLTSSGNCVVVFGMATERVTAALGLAFKDIAAEMVQFESERMAPDTEREMAKRRRAYATDYLQKLVNIEIKVPAAQQQEQHQLLRQDMPEPRRRMKVSFGEFAGLWPLGLACMALSLGIWLGNFGDQILDKSTTAQAAATPPLASSPTATRLDASPRPSIPTNVPREAPHWEGEIRAYEVQTGEVANLAEKSEWTLFAFLPIVLMVSVVGVRLWRRTLVQTRDSLKFQIALEIWTPLVAARRNTPRAIKRFGNRLRYLAMLQQGEEHDKTPLDMLRDMLQMPRLWDVHGESTPTSRFKRLTEHQLIALGALHELYGPCWKEKMTTVFCADWPSIPLDASTGEDNELLKAAMAHRNKFGGSWPPSAQEIETFERLMAGVRLPAEPEPESSAQRGPSSERPRRGKAGSARVPEKSGPA